MPVRIEGGSFGDIAAGIASFVQQATWKIAQEEAAKLGFDSTAVIVTDGVRGKAPQDVKPFGKIVYVADTSIADAVLWALDQLVKISPVGPAEGGHYRDDHIVMINGTAVTGNLRIALGAVKAGDRVMIVNPRIYARKLEGATASKRAGRYREKRKASSRQAPNGVYRVVVRQLVQRYSKSMFFDYKLVGLNTGDKVWGDFGGGRVRINGQWIQRQARRRVQRDQVYPAIQIFKKSTDPLAT